MPPRHSWHGNLARYELAYTTFIALGVKKQITSLKGQHGFCYVSIGGHSLGHANRLSSN
jgi:hypothetical protein